MTPENLIKPWKPNKQRPYIFYNANVIDVATGTVRPNSTVRISNGLIERVADTTPDDSQSENAITVDLEGKYLCPGLIDSHVHLCAVPGQKDLGNVFGMSPAVSTLRQPYVCQQMLQRGFTSVRDCGGALLALKEAVSDGVFPGPRIFIAGHALSQSGGHGDFRGAHDLTDCCGGTLTGLGRLCDGVSECMKAAREELRTGADFIKIMGSGGVSSPTDRLENVQFTPEEIRAIVTVAANNSTYVTAHAYTPRSIRHAVENGVRGIEHGNLLDEETAKFMAEKGVFMTPTLITYSEMASDRWKGFLPDDLLVKNEQVLKAGLQSIKIASDAGVTLCFGTDLLGPLSIAQTHEFSIRSKVLSPAEILKSATVNPARMLQQEAFLGQIQPGFAADLLVLNKNPLEDVVIFDSPDKHLLAVVKDGRVYSSRWTKLPDDVSVHITSIE